MAAASFRKLMVLSNLNYRTVKAFSYCSHKHTCKWFCFSKTAKQLRRSQEKPRGGIKSDIAKCPCPTLINDVTL